MPERRTIILDNDLTSEIVDLQLAGGTWVLNFNKPTEDWYWRYTDWQERDTDLQIRMRLELGNEARPGITQRKASAQEMWQLAEEVLCPENGDAIALHSHGMSAVRAVLDFFSTAWDNGGGSWFQRWIKQNRPELIDLNETLPLPISEPRKTRLA